MDTNTPLLIATLLAGEIGTAAGQSSDPQPYTFFTDYIGLNDEEVREIQQGTPVTKILETDAEIEVAIFGAVWINADVEGFIARQRDIERFESGDAVQAIKKISVPPKMEDFAALRLTGRRPRRSVGL